MRFAVLVRSNDKIESGVLPTAEQLTTMGKFNEQLIKDGVMLAGDGLQPSSKGARITFSSGKAHVVDGPFAESKELIAGFWMVQGKSKEEIVERFKHAPMEEGDTLEIRQLFEAEDFGDNMSAEMREREERLRASLS